jgi:hypothetical protein
VSNVDWLDWVLESATGDTDEDGIKNTALTLAYLSDADGLLPLARIEEHYELEPGSLREIFPGTDCIRLRKPSN